MDEFGLPVQRPSRVHAYLYLAGSVVCAIVSLGVWIAASFYETGRDFSAARVRRALVPAQAWRRATRAACEALNVRHTCATTGDYLGDAGGSWGMFMQVRRVATLLSCGPMFPRNE